MQDGTAGVFLLVEFRASEKFKKMAGSGCTSRVLSKVSTLWQGVPVTLKN